MTGSKKLNAAISILALLGIVVLGLVFGEKWAAAGGIIPRFLFVFPDAPLNHSDFWFVVKTFTAAHLIIFAGITWAAGANVFNQPRRTALDLYGMIAGFALTSFGLFLLSEIPFDPEFFACAFVLSALFLAVAQSAGTVRQDGMSALWRAPTSLIVQSFKSLKSLAGVFVVVSVLIPVVTAAVYVTNQDFANAVTRLRVSLNSGGGGDWKFTDLYDGQRFLQPMLERFAPGGDFYVLERGGKVYKLAAPKHDNKELVLDFSANVGIAEKENGAQGFDFHPNFAGGTEQLFVYYTDYSDPEHQVNKLSRFDLSAATVEERSSTEFVLIAQGRRNDGFHNGGTVVFGPDGFLYLSLGEMSADEERQTIDRNLRGGILRLDPLMQGGTVSHAPSRQPNDGKTQGYFIPNDNPFVGQPNALEEFWALGLRNPFRIDFDPETGALWAGEVGSTVWEEVNVIEAGGNYQFPFIEGGPPEEPVIRPDVIVGTEREPRYFYRHTAFDRAVIGGTVYRGEKHPSLAGNYLFADNYSGKVWAIAADDPAPESPNLLTQVNQVAQRGITSIQQTPGGDIIITTLGESTVASGRVLRLVSKEEWEALGLKDEVTVVKEDSIPLTRAKALYGENCARCHGDSGKGDGPDAPDIDVPLPDFTSSTFHNARSEGDLREFILKGGDALGRSYWMPPWEGILTDAEVDGM